eukprot:3985981-Alexandrium_andersonii.AAC.1
MPTREFHFGGFAGVRVGEASHPGPAGSRRSARKRRTAAVGAADPGPALGLGGDLVKQFMVLLGPLLKQLVREMAH